MADMLRIARKELGVAFGSPVAYLFLGAFLAVTLFVFFWVETFFARNIADVRPLFQWMPVLLIFLVAALTMRSWSEERRSGTLELLATAPVSPLALVLGKFLANLTLLTVALVLTLPLPITVSLLGPLDWGPVAGGYLATLFLAAAYTAIGLYVSARTDNPIVSLILTVLVCALFYLLGSGVFTGLFGGGVGEFLEALGTGSRFESIGRGVLDLRDLYYYVSLVGVFLSLNLLALERLGWTRAGRRAHHRQWLWLVGLTAANFLAANLWLASVGWARADITEGRIYTLSDATKVQLGQLREPLLIRGYFSAQTHPLLAPLVPRLRDLLEEYAVAAGGEGREVRVEFLDPHDDPGLEEEAGGKYGIKPVPFQSASKYQASVVNSYFDILVAYGDQYETLGFRDLIELKSRGETDLEVDLDNPEYAITQAIKKVLTTYQGGGNPFEALSDTVTFSGYLSSPALLPEPLAQLRADLESVLADLEQQAGGKFEASIVDPDADGGRTALELQERYGFRPLVAGLLDPNPFWFYLVLEAGGQTVQVPLPDDLDKAGLERGIQAALKRLSPGFLKTVALVAPERRPAMFGGMGGGEGYRQLREYLGESVRLEETDLRSGRVPADADLLLLLSPESLDRKQRFAVDQFLMQGGTVVLATAPYEVDVDTTFRARRIESGLEDWLKFHGLELEPGMVLDLRNAALPVPVERRIGGFSVQEIHMLDYPYFPDLRDAALNPDSGITAGLGQLTLTWASPIRVDSKAAEARRVTELLHSSADSWSLDALDVLPDYDRYPEFGFPVGEHPAPQLLGVVMEGRFESYFKGKDSPLLAADEDAEAEADAETEAEAGQAPGAEGGEGATAAAEPPVYTGVLDQSAESARIVLFASNSFLGDTALDLATEGLGTVYTKPLELVQNAIEWSLEDRGLLTIRGRGHFARTLAPMERGWQLFWELLNYGLALLGLVLVYWVYRRVRRAGLARYAHLLEGV